jgi:hypothetical protein
VKCTVKGGAIAAIYFVLGASSSRAQQMTPDSAVAIGGSVFHSLVGRWGCRGGFPNGRALEADMTFDTTGNGRALRFAHQDRAPGTYWLHSYWSLDARTARIFSNGVSGSTKDQNAAPLTLVATEWNKGSVTFTSDTAKGVPNRYVYSLGTDGSLKMSWYLGTNGAWFLGDSLVCRRD